MTCDCLKAAAKKRKYQEMLCYLFLKNKTEMRYLLTILF